MPTDMEGQIDMNFDSLWHFIVHRGIPVVQNKDELNHIYDLIKDCRSYLEVGSAEGNSLFVLGKALLPLSTIVSVDKCEDGTRVKKQEVLNLLQESNLIVHEIKGFSYRRETVKEASFYSNYDVVFIDAGHDYEDVIADALCYGIMAKKYIIFHDILLEPVKQAFDWYVKKQHLQDRSYTFGTEYGYGVIKL